MEMEPCGWVLKKGYTVPNCKGKQIKFTGGYEKGKKPDTRKSISTLSEQL